MHRTLLLILAVVLIAVAAVAALTVASGRQYVERNGLDEYGNIRGDQNTGGFPGTPPAIPPAPDDGVACTMDAMQCPDGSFVGRVPPSCSFAPCPGQ